MTHDNAVPLVRFNLHLRRDHLTPLTRIAEQLASKKGRAVRLGEALELVLTAGLSKSHDALLALAVPDTEAPHWLRLGTIERRRCGVLLPQPLRS